MCASSQKILRSSQSSTMSKSWNCLTTRLTTRSWWRETTTTTPPSRRGIPHGSIPPSHQTMTSRMWSTRYWRPAIFPKNPLRNRPPPPHSLRKTSNAKHTDLPDWTACGLTNRSPAPPSIRPEDSPYMTPIIKSTSPSKA